MFKGLAVHLMFLLQMDDLKVRPLLRFLILCLSFLSDSGIGLESGVFVATLAPGSPAARDSALAVGDRLLAVSMLAKNLQQGKRGCTFNGMR